MATVHEQPAVGASNDAWRRMSAAVVLSVLLAVVLRRGMRWWSGTTDWKGHQSPARGFFQRMRTLAAKRGF